MGHRSLLAERFPSLFDCTSTATTNDTFIAGTSAGYAYLNQMTDEQIQVYGTRAGRLSAKYGPQVFDTYGYANLSTTSSTHRLQRRPVVHRLRL